MLLSAPLFLAVAAIASAQPACVGDCNADQRVAINELVVAVRVLLGDAQLSACPAIDCGGRPGPPINCAVLAVGNSLEGCEAPAAPCAGLGCFNPCFRGEPTCPCPLNCVELFTGIVDGVEYFCRASVCDRSAKQMQACVRELVETTTLCVDLTTPTPTVPPTPRTPTVTSNSENTPGEFRSSTFDGSSIKANGGTRFGAVTK